ncbi:MAG: NAD(P)/FAD-dependent oxidoreductase [Chitinophagales bacterium]|nr:NAD(P)/FAD-dependent oxidoreductase [Chitinophagales bacterium]HAE35481.1 pyridine nucleotide-disulfide oxidoreductase [Bacteroidota bacterium]MCB9022868.1 NAD(P)/FAD-dependent oxidoreductase [Chitinophagales bacterium]HPE98423.1 FAD/NAD(P)-binding oxidoreductase [Chitinophagales bacterium]HQU40917.1 FAD/NAD(P)-binding oxidoreductase [Chitinophagales bacterium]
MASTKLLIIGGGTAGIMVAAKFRKEHKNVDVTLLEPGDTHYYQPAWTLVGAGTFDFKKTARSMSSVMPKGVNWVKDKATGFDPENNLVHTEKNGDIPYDYLVVATGLVMEPTMIEGLAEALDKGTVVSNYTNPEYTWEVIRNFKGGNAVFTQPTTPIKCGGAPQKIAYLAADYFRKKGIADKSNVIFATPGTVIFGVKPIAHTLMEVINRYDIHFKPFYAPHRIDSENKIIHFKHSAPEENRCVINEDNSLGETMVGDTDISIPYDMLHLAPPQAAPRFVRESRLANAQGWLDVNINTLQHNRYPNVFGLGDVAALPTAKTGAAIRKQVPVVVNNLVHLMQENKLGSKEYNGYSSCPLVTGYGKMVLAEFDYQNNFTPDPKLKQMLVFNSDKEHWRLWMLKKYGLPYLYWNKMLKGVDV